MSGRETRPGEEIRSRGLVRLLNRRADMTCQKERKGKLYKLPMMNLVVGYIFRDPDHELGARLYRGHIMFDQY